MSFGLALRAFAFVGCLLVVGSSAAWSPAAEHVHVLFDIPDKIECRDVTPEKCAATHPTQKVIEAKFRISAGFTEGNENSILDFAYLITSPGLRMKVLDYLPNTTLESRYADDLIEVADYTEDATSSSQEARVGYSIFSLNAVRSQVARKTEQNQYQRIAPKSLVLAAGTMNRGHGVFYKLRPSNAASLEGAKEFTFLAIVPRSWRGDWCTFVCSARANKKSLLGTSVVPAGLTKVDVGLYLCGDAEASDLAGRLCAIQQQDDAALTKHFSAEAVKTLETMLELPSAAATSAPLGRFEDFLHLSSLKGTPSRTNDRRLEAARRQFEEAEAALERLAGAENVPYSARRGE
jgi:hypothetical protein